jgi:hypothetical protein
VIRSNFQWSGSGTDNANVVAAAAGQQPKPAMLREIEDVLEYRKKILSSAAK